MEAIETFYTGVSEDVVLRQPGLGDRSGDGDWFDAAGPSFGQRIAVLPRRQRDRVLRRLASVGNAHGEDFTERPDVGGIAVGGKAICPWCEPKWRRGLRRENEEHHIVAVCPPGKSFADWVRQDLRK